MDNNDPMIIIFNRLTSEFIWDYYPIITHYSVLKVPILNLYIFLVKLFVAHANSEKSAREKLKLHVVNHKIKKFHGQLQILGVELDKIYIVARHNF